MSVRPARLAGLDGHGRPIAIGEPANLTLVDPAAHWTVDRDSSRSLGRNNPWHGRTFTARVTTTLLRGRVTLRDGVVADPLPAATDQRSW